MAQALLHSTVKMTVLPLCLIKKPHAWSLLSLPVPTYLVAVQADADQVRCCVGIHALQTDKTD